MFCVLCFLAWSAFEIGHAEDAGAVDVIGIVFPTQVALRPP